MAKIRRFESTGRVSRTPLPRAPLDILDTGDVGAEVIAAGEQVVARAVAETKRRNLIEANNQVSIAKLSANRILNTVDDRTRESKDLSVEAQTKVQQDITTELKALRPTNKKAAQAFDAALAEKIPAMEETVSESFRKKIEGNHLALEDAWFEHLKRTGDPIEYLIMLEKGVKLGITGRDSQELIAPLKEAAIALAEKVNKQRDIAAKKTVTDRLANEIAEKPVATGEMLAGELERRKEGKGLIPEDTLPSKDIQSLINLANAREIQGLEKTQRERNESQRVEETRIHKELFKGTMDVTDISTNEILDAAAMRRLVKDEKDIKQMTLDKNWPLNDDFGTKQELQGLVSDMEAGTISTAEMYQEINKAVINRRLTESTYDKFRAIAFNDGRTAIQKAVDIQVKKIENALLSRITDKQARFQFRDLEGLTSAERREFSTGAFDIQINEHQVLMITEAIEAELNAVAKETGKGKDVVSGKEANAITARVWTRFRGKDTAQKIKDFKRFSGKQLPMPEGFPQNRWDEASDEEKTEIHDLRIEGFDDDAIIEALNQ